MTDSNSTIQSTPKQVKINNRADKPIDFLMKARALYGDKYIYDKTNYQRSKIKVIITCPEHGDFVKEPRSFLAGAACTKCSGRYRRSKSDFIIDARKLHGDKYSYDKVEFKKVDDRVIITCDVHGDFEQSIVNHLKKYGCTKCGLERMASGNTRTQKEFIKLAKKAHGDRYSYSKTKYVSSNDVVTITCSLHGDFEQLSQSHIAGHGCQRCSFEFTGHSRTGFKVLCDKNNSGNGILYAIKCFSGNEVFYKVGITSRSIKKRFNSITDIPYDYEVLYSVSANSDYIFDLERKLHNLLISHLYQPLLPFGGQTECFTTIKPIEKLLKELSTTEQMQLLA